MLNISANNWSRYSLRTVFLLMAAVAIPLGLSIAWDAVMGLWVCMAAAIVLFAVTRKRSFGLAALLYFTGLALVVAFVFWDVGAHGPYVRSYNERLQAMAIEADLVGSSEERVQDVLGAATAIWSDSSYGTTYNYAPYPGFPYAKFQVHCEDGVVQSIELYDD
jgi:hypothetical protein